MTPQYCPPELSYSDMSKLSPKVDIFSFGMLKLIYFFLKLF